MISCWSNLLSSMVLLLPTHSFVLACKRCKAHFTDGDFYLSERIVTVLEWPPQSTDLNPIENLWGRGYREFVGLETSFAAVIFNNIPKI